MSKEAIQIKEALGQTAETAKLSTECDFFGINVTFRGWPAEVASINVLESQFDQLRQFLSYREASFDNYANFKPENALVIFDNGQPRLIMVKGKRETWSTRSGFWPFPKAKLAGSGQYVHILKVDSNDSVHAEGAGDGELAPLEFEKEGISGFNASWYLPDKGRGAIFISKDRGVLFILGAAGAPTNLG